jgi:CheY-like chemotaxis protein
METSSKSAARMKKFLLVEDDPDLQVLLTRQIEWMGFTAILATNGIEGVKKAVKEKPHMIIMDIMMPGIDGRHAVRLIRSNPNTQDIPILAATVLCKLSDRKSCIDAGCNDYLAKPFSFDALREKVQALIPASSPNLP